MRALPGTSYFSHAPDWVCEVASSGAASFRARKMAVYAGEGVSHAWLIDPDARTIDVRRLENGRSTNAPTHVGKDVVRLEPFDGIQIPARAAVGRLNTRPRFRAARGVGVSPLAPGFAFAGSSG